MQVKNKYKKTEVGSIPEDWDCETVGKAFEIHNNLRLPISEKIRKEMTGPYPYYGPTGVQSYINEWRVEGEYALIGEDGDHFLKWRDQAMVLLVGGKFNVNNHAHLVKGSKNLTKWFFYFFSHRNLTPHLTRQSAVRYKLTKRTLLDIPCAVPPPPEQRAITELLSDVDALIEGLTKLLDKKRNLKQAAMQQLLTGRMRLPGFSGEWQEKRLDEIADIDTDNLGAQTPPGWEFKYISLEDVDEGSLRSYSEQTFLTAPSRARRKLRKGDILISTVRPNLKSHLMFTAEGPNWVCSTGFSVARCKTDQAFPAYVFFHLFSDGVCSQIDTFLTGSNYPAINGTDVKALRLPIPSVPEQIAIAQVLSDMGAEITTLEKRRDKTLSLKQGMMQELLTGRIRLI